MAEYLVNGEKLTAVANAIRIKTGSSDALTIDQMVTEIGGLISAANGAVLVINTAANASVTITKDGETYTKTSNADGAAIFQNIAEGIWSVTVVDGGVSKTVSIEVSENTTVSIILESIPEFTYTGTYQIVNDDDVAITTSPDNWKIRLLTGGTFKFTKLNGAANGIDVFCVGGGAAGAQNIDQHTSGGGGGGYTTTKTNIKPTVNYDYSIVVGGGGSGHGAAGGASSAFGVSANGGDTVAKGRTGGKGGSGGGGGGQTVTGGKGGSDGSDGSISTKDTAQNWITQANGGAGQGTTTREFGEANGKLYAGGGGGGYGGAGGEGGGGTAGVGTDADEAGKPGTANTGGGGGGMGRYGFGKWSGAGGSGIVIIRNKRG